MQTTVLSPTEWQERVKKFNAGRKYFAMYSSVVGGITTDTQCMQIPMDDHMVHRGDGVFEALRAHHGALYDLEAHLARMQVSAEKIFLKCPLTLAEMRQVVIETARAANVDDGVMRLFLSRGPGSFSVAPNDTVGSQFYAVMTAHSPVRPELVQQGARVIVAQTPQKPDFYAQIKSCNYLQNVLVKQEALRAGADFAVSFTNGGYLAEGPTENVCFVDGAGVLVTPHFSYTLKGTTLLRVLDLARKLIGTGDIKGIESRHATREDLRSAREMALIGTTLEVMPVREFDGQRFEMPSKVFGKLLAFLQEDFVGNKSVRTEYGR